MKHLVIPISSILLCLGAILIILSGKDSSTKREFDERQRIARGDAYTAGFWILLTYLIGSNLAQSLLGRPWCTPETDIFFPVLLAVGTFGVCCVVNDAFILPGERSVGKILVLIFLGLGNIVITIPELQENGLVTTEGLLDIPVQLSAGVIFFILAAALLWKAHRAKVQAREEDA